MHVLMFALNNLKTEELLCSRLLTRHWKSCYRAAGTNQEIGGELYAAR